MRILSAHNQYAAHGGECVVFMREAEALRRAGHEVATLTRTSVNNGGGILAKLRMAVSSFHCKDAVCEAEDIIRDFAPDVAHFHNLYPRISPSVMLACRRAGIPVVYTCHNYRTICPVGTFSNGRSDCFRCTPRNTLPCILRNCRGSLPESLIYALRNTAAWSRGAWDAVTLFVAPSHAVRRTLANHGLIDEKIRVVYNPVPIPERPADPTQGEYVAFAGRPSAEKGYAQLFAAAAMLPEIPFRVAGGGFEAVAFQAPANVSFAGHLPESSMQEFWRNARLAVVPSCYIEAFGLTAAEAQATGLPVVASDTGGLSEIVEDGVTGALCPCGDVEALASQIGRIWKDADMQRAMGEKGRERAASLFSMDAHMERLLAVYAEAITLARTENPTS